MDALLDALRNAPGGLTLTQQSRDFSGNIPAARIEAARDYLEGRGLIETEEIREGPGPPPARFTDYEEHELTNKLRDE